MSSSIRDRKESLIFKYQVKHNGIPDLKLEHSFTKDNKT